MKAQLNYNDYDITWLNSPAIEGLVFQMDSKIVLDWDVKLDAGSYWARLIFEVVSKEILLEGTYYSETNEDEEKPVSINVELEDVEIETGNIKDYGSFCLVELNLELSLSELDVERIRDGQPISIKAKKAQVKIQDA